MFFFLFVGLLSTLGVILVKMLSEIWYLMETFDLNDSLARRTVFLGCLKRFKSNAYGLNYFWKSHVRSLFVLFINPRILRSTSTEILLVNLKICYQQV